MSGTNYPNGVPVRFRGMRSYRARMSVPQDIQEDLIRDAANRRIWRGQRASMNGCVPMEPTGDRPRLAEGKTRQQYRRGQKRTKHEQVRFYGKRAYRVHLQHTRAMHGGWIVTPFGKHFGVSEMLTHGKDQLRNDMDESLLAAHLGAAHLGAANLEAQA